MNRTDSVGAAAAVGSWGTPALKYSTTSRTFVERAVVEERARVLELTQRQDAKPECVARVVGDFLPPDVFGVVGKAILTQIGGVQMTPRQRIQRLDRVITDADVDEILLDEGANAGCIRIHWAACSASGRCGNWSSPPRRRRRPPA